MVDAKIIRDGAKAVSNTAKRWETDWIPIGLGLIELRKLAVEESGGSPGSKSYNAAFGALLLRHKYDETLLEKNTRTALLNLFVSPDMLAKLNQIIETYQPATRAGLTPRTAWDLVKPAGKAKEDKADKEAPETDTLSSGAQLQEALANAQDELSRAVVLTGDLEARVAELWAIEEHRPRLVALAEAINACRFQTPAQKARKPRRKTTAEPAIEAF